MDYFHWVYVSSVSETLSEKDLKDILVVARQNNEHKHLSGLLLYAHGRFMQVLEGAESEVLSTMEKIRADNRHKNIDTLRLEKKMQRDFSEWSMGFVNLELSDINGYSRFLEPSFDTTVFDNELGEAYQLLLAFRNHHVT